MPPESAAGLHGRDTHSDRVRRYALLMLTITYTLNFVDRQILGILVEPIKLDLGVSDTQMGLLTGLAFAIFYTVMGIPIARLADRTNRRTLIAIALATWSLFTALQGLAQSYWQLLLYRMGVGVGEAGCSPPSHSIIADYYPPERRATALGVYSLGIPIGMLIGFFVGGWMNEFFGWRVALIVIGLPGVLLAVIVQLTVREPARGMADGHRTQGDSQPSILETIRHLQRRRSFLHICIGAGLTAFVGYGVVSWVAAFMVRSHGMGSGELGTWLGLIFGIPGGIGIWLGGWIADRYGARDPRWYLWTVTVILLLSLPLAYLVYTAQSAATALLALAPAVMLSNCYQATTFAQTQTLAGVRMRATSAAILLFILNMIGLALGPTTVGILSDLLAPQYGADSLRWALLLCASVNVWAAFHYWMAGRYFLQDLALNRSEREITT